MTHFKLRLNRSFSCAIRFHMCPSMRVRMRQGPTIGPLDQRKSFPIHLSTKVQEVLVEQSNAKRAHSHGEMVMLETLSCGVQWWEWWHICRWVCWSSVFVCGFRICFTERSLFLMCTCFILNEDIFMNFYIFPTESFGCSRWLWLSSHSRWYCFPQHFYAPLESDVPMHTIHDLTTPIRCTTILEK